MTDSLAARLQERVSQQNRDILKFGEKNSRLFKENKSLRAELAALQLERAASAQPISKEVLEFLTGRGPLEGVWFDDPHPSGRSYWWRKYL